MDPDAPKPMQTTSTFTPPSDPSKFIRTYAKDVAMLTNTPVPASPSPASTKAANDKDEADALGVGLPDFDASPINHPNDPASPKEFKQETVELSESDSDDIFTTKKTETEDREAILQRLRAKVAAGQKAGGFNLAPPPSAPIAPVAQIPPVVPVAPPAPEPAPAVTPTPAPEPAPEPFAAANLAEELSATIQAASDESLLRTAAPTFASSYEPVPSIPPLNQEKSIPAPATPEPIKSAELSPLHTFSSDFADRIDEEKSSTFSVLAAQSDAGQTPKSTTRPVRRNLLPLIAGVGMVVIGIGAIVGAYVFTRSAPPAPVVAGIPSLITYDEAIELKGTGPGLKQALSDAAQGTNITGNVIVTYITTTDATTGAVSAPQPGGELIKALALPAPDILLRNIDDSSTVGFIHAGSESRPFFVLKVNSYERTFAGMLAWEANMPSDLSTLYPQYPNMPASASSTASTSPRVILQSTPHFTDAVVDNYDVRIIRDSSGRSLMLYGYRGKDTLIIARDEAAFTSLISRLSAVGN